MKKNARKAFGTGEWAEFNVNIQSGCQHGCLYCYAQGNAIRFGRETPESWLTPKINRKAVEKGYRKRRGRIMFPTSHDITPGNIEEVVTVLRKMLESGNEVLIVSKPHPVCIRRICKEFADYKNQILFRFTIGSADDKVLRFWDPFAPRFNGRMKALKLAHAAGYRTSISMEPLLDTKPEAVIKAVRPYVTDSIWLGRVNQLRQAIALNCPGDEEAKRRADELLAAQSDDWIRKLYKKYKNDSLIKWKDSIKEVVGLKRPTKKGLDI